MEEKYTRLLEKADAWIAAHKEEFISEIQGLVRIPSVSRADLAEPGAPFGPDCRKVLDYALERGRFYGFETIDHDGYAGSVCLGDADAENSIGMIAHLDVVPVGDGWIYPPFDATYLPEYDAIVGRGTDDNKGPAVLGLFAMRMLREFGWPLKHGIRLICGMSEETGMQDMTALLNKGEKFPKLSLVPDSGFPVNYAQKGSIGGELEIPCEGNLIAFDAGSVRNVVPDHAECTLAVDIETVKNAVAALDPELVSALNVTVSGKGTVVTATGRAAHAAGPAAGISAIQLLTRALTQSGLLEGSCARAAASVCELTSDPFGESEGVAFRDEASGELTLVYGVAHLRDGVLQLSIDSRVPISCDPSELCGRLTAGAWANLGFTVARRSTSKPFYIPKDDPRVTGLQELYKAITGSDAQPYSMGGGTYSRVVPNAITFGAGLPTAVNPSDFLPEGHGACHGKDEVLIMEKIYTATKIYLLALAFLDEILD
ncbi:MAG: Sapep family Mn(2+)-dependent dipeptidase [Clostridia bacterium]|nr:Sapep family Mn(2+)-dependent dipeptidase [Clostridia bacterium]